MANNSAGLVDAVNLEDIPGGIRTDRDRHVPWMAPFGGAVSRPALAQCDAAGGAIPTINGAPMARELDQFVVRRRAGIRVLMRLVQATGATM